MKQFVANARLPVRLDDEPRPFGDVELSVINPMRLCKSIAENSYMAKLGIRSLKNAVRTSIKEAVFDKYPSIPTRIKDPGHLTEMTTAATKDAVTTNITQYDGQPFHG